MGNVDADAFDSVIGGFVQQLCAAVAPAGRRHVLAVDGKTLRGSRHTDGEGTVEPGRHLLAVIDQHPARAAWLASVQAAQAVWAAAQLVLAARAAPAWTGTWRWPAKHGGLGPQVRIGL